MDVQVVYDQDNPFSLWVNHIYQIVQNLRKVQLGASLSHPHMSKATQGLYCQEQSASAVPLILIVLSL